MKFSFRLFPVLFLLAAGVWRPSSVSAAHWTEIYNPRFWGSASMGAYTAPSNLTVATTTGGVYTNAGVTNGFTYRLYGTNSQGRTPISTNSMTFVGSAGSNAVAISWDRLDGVSGYVLEKSYDAGATWTNYFHYSASATNATDWQPSSFWNGSNTVAVIPAGDLPWTNNGAGSSNAAWGSISGTLADQADLTQTVAQAASALQSVPLTNSLIAATNALDARLTDHTTNVIPHVSVADRTNWNGKATLGDVAGLSNSVTTLNAATNNINTIQVAVVASTGSLNIAVGNLNASTNALQIQVTSNSTWKVGTNDARYLAALTNLDLSGWSGVLATQQVTWAETLTNNTLTLSGAGLSPNLNGVVMSNISAYGGNPRWRSTNWFVWNETGTYLIGTNGTFAPSGNYWQLGGTNPVGQYAPVGGAGVISVAYSSVQWRAGFNAVTTNYEISRDGVVLVTTTNLTTLGAFLALSNRVTAVEAPYQPYTSTGVVTSGTCTVTFASGSLVELTATESPTTLTFDNTNYPTNGVSRVAVELLAGTNSIAFATATITNSTAPTISTSTWTLLIFRRSGNNATWIGGQVK